MVAQPEEATSSASADPAMMTKEEYAIARLHLCLFVCRKIAFSNDKFTAGKSAYMKIAFDQAAVLLSEALSVR
jgi:hypothetical protein